MESTEQGMNSQRHMPKSQVSRDTKRVQQWSRAHYNLTTVQVAGIMDCDCAENKMTFEYTKENTTHTSSITCPVPANVKSSKPMTMCNISRLHAQTKELPSPLRHQVDGLLEEYNKGANQSCSTHEEPSAGKRTSNHNHIMQEQGRVTIPRLHLKAGRNVCCKHLMKWEEYSTDMPVSQTITNHNIC